MVYFDINIRTTTYIRQVYSLVDLLGEMGGITSAVVSIVAFLIASYQLMSQKIFAVNLAFKILVEKIRPAICREGERISDTNYDKFLKTKNFTTKFTSFMMVFLPKRIRKPIKDENYFERGVKKIERSIDILTFLRTLKRLKIIEKALFNSKQLQLSRMTRW
jgi:hypothetical protein